MLVKVAVDVWKPPLLQRLECFRHGRSKQHEFFWFGHDIGKLQTVTFTGAPEVCVCRGGLQSAVRLLAVPTLFFGDSQRKPFPYMTSQKRMLIVANAARGELVPFVMHCVFKTFLCIHTRFLYMITHILHTLGTFSRGRCWLRCASAHMFDVMFHTCFWHDHIYIWQVAGNGTVCTCSHVRCHAPHILLTWSHMPSGEEGC